MISAIVFTQESWRGEDVAREREIVARSMVWLVKAVVAGVVRDVTLAVPAGLGLASLADQSGCALVQAETEADRLREAIEACREPRVMVLRAGFQPEASLVDEIDAFVHSAPQEARAVLRGAPATLIQRLFPQSAPIVGLIRPRSAPIAGGFGAIAREAGRGVKLLHARAHPIR